MKKKLEVAGLQFIIQRNFDHGNQSPLFLVEGKDSGRKSQDQSQNFPSFLATILQILKHIILGVRRIMELAQELRLVINNSIIRNIYIASDLNTHN